MDIMVDKKIEVTFIKCEGLSARPIAHTCGPLLEIPSTYANYAELREDFMNILNRDTWEMDIIWTKCYWPRFWSMNLSQTNCGRVESCPAKNKQQMLMGIYEIDAWNDLEPPLFFLFATKYCCSFN